MQKTMDSWQSTLSYLGLSWYHEFKSKPLSTSASQRGLRIFSSLAATLRARFCGPFPHSTPGEIQKKTGTGFNHLLKTTLRQLTTVQMRRRVACSTTYERSLTILNAPLLRLNVSSRSVWSERKVTLNRRR